MNDDLLAKVPPRLAQRYRAERPGGADKEMLRLWWRSVVCMTCGGCCHSSLIPITADDFDRFYERLRLSISKERFTAIMLADPDTAAPTYTLETKRHGGRCLFLEKQDGLFACSRWDQRADVCADFFCWPMTQFERYDKGEDQEMFPTDLGWEENLLSLFDKVVEEMGGALFADDLFRYIKSQRADSFDAVDPDQVTT